MIELRKPSRNEKDGFRPSKPSVAIPILEETIKACLLVLGAWLVIANAVLPRQPRSCATLDFAFFYFFLVPLSLTTLGALLHDVAVSRSEERGRVRRRLAAFRIAIAALVLIGLVGMAVDPH